MKSAPLLLAAIRGIGATLPSAAFSAALERHCAGEPSRLKLVRMLFDPELEDAPEYVDVPVDV